ncbi:phenylacetyl-CoA ligase [uncultured delta proteobacterium]|uniref:Phenylacetate-coenzyme A ligase n=1 Tax=uncultured delta proteobacterium TaxID=34034 RepID=A0A212J4N4_9DELT|nr:phenylacetyl-CoA ligase [uncultured delta proteobacterium]
MMFNVEKEMLPREELQKLQLLRLRNLCERVYANVPHYRKAFDAAGMHPSDVCSLGDLARLPFTEKQDLRNGYPFGMFAVPRDVIVRLHASSGTTGKSTVVGYTHRDIDIWSECMARSMRAAGMTSRDLLHNAYGYGLFTGGLGAHYGAEKLGATVIPVSGGATKRQAQLLRDFGATAVCCTPSYILFLYEAAEEMGINVKELPLRVGIFGAEPWTEEMRQDIENKLGIDALNIYGLSEVMGPGISMECLEAKCGMHIWEDHFLPEIIDPVSGKVKGPGETGELVLTTLTKEGIPLVRYRTRDITSLDYTPCACGRTHVRMGRILGRSDDMLIIRGVNVFPQQIEGLLLEMEGVSPHYQIEVRREDSLDVMEVKVEFSEEMFASDEVRHIQKREADIQKAIKDFLGVTAKVRMVEPKSLARYEGKSSRVTDLRGQS